MLRGDRSIGSPVGKDRGDLSRRFRQAYTVALTGGVAMTLLASAHTIREIAGLRARHGDDPSFDDMWDGTLVRASATISLLVLLWLLVLRPMAANLAAERSRLLEAESVLRSVVSRQDLHAQVLEALEMADDEPSVHRIVRRTMAKVAPGTPAELLLADSSRAHLTRVAENPSAGAPGCGVKSPWHCPAVRRGRTSVFESSEDIDACPQLFDRPGGACAAVCVPISFMGKNLGVLHLTGPDGDPPDTAVSEALSSAATQAGSRIGTLRSFARAQLQAATDGLTGLSNRRATSELVGRLLRHDEVVAVAMVDLDHFKTVNDAYGHEAGDRALRAFADVARRTVREGDVVGRWGGEEFVIAMPGLDRAEAAAVMNRLRSALAEAAARADSPAVTASIGVVDSTVSRELDEAVRLADEALLAAKAQGRNRVVIGPVVLDPATAPTSR